MLPPTVATLIGFPEQSNDEARRAPMRHHCAKNKGHLAQGYTALQFVDHQSETRCGPQVADPIRQVSLVEHPRVLLSVSIRSSFIRWECLQGVQACIGGHARGAKCHAQVCVLTVTVRISSSSKSRAEILILIPCDFKITDLCMHRSVSFSSLSRRCWISTCLESTRAVIRRSCENRSEGDLPTSVWLIRSSRWTLSGAQVGPAAAAVYHALSLSIILLAAVRYELDGCLKESNAISKEVGQIKKVLCWTTAHACPCVNA